VRPLRALATLLLVAIAVAAPIIAYDLTKGPGPIAKQAPVPPVVMSGVTRALNAEAVGLKNAQGYRAVPVLTYHAVSESGGRYSVTPETFAAQMTALSRAGYHTISLAQFNAWQKGEKVRLPKNPMLITFDDGIKSVWVHADPIFKKLGFRAVMFTITGRASTHQPYYLTWQELQRMAGNGRWDIASHTRDGHHNIKISPHGRQGAFLTNLMWLPRKNRLETLAEYTKRVSTDLDGSVADIRRHGITPASAFAFPFSASKYPTNDPRVPDQLEKLVLQRFDVVVDNTPGSPEIPAHAGRRYLSRIEVVGKTTTRSLLARLAVARPIAPELPPSGKEMVYDFLDTGSLARADLIMKDEYQMPRYRAVHIPVIRWDEDPYREVYWRFNFYGLQPCVDLLWAYRTTGEAKYYDKLLEILRSYIKADDARVDRFGKGFRPYRWDNKYSSAIRSLILINVRGKLAARHKLPADVEAGTRRALQRLGHFLELSENFNVSNNHGFAETAALYAIAVNLPDLPKARLWRHMANDRLSQLINRNVDGGGVQVERSPFYHYYVLRLATKMVDWADRAHIRLPPVFIHKTDEMVRYATFVVQPNDQLPLLGSSVKTDVARLERAMFTRFGTRYPEFEYARLAGLSGRRPTERNVRFKDSGDAIMRSGWGTADNYKASTHVDFNIGRARTQHAHHDALAINYYSAGRTLLPDSGLFTYDFNDWRKYFWSTRAHNTITIDDANQSVGPVHQGGLITGRTWSYQSGSQSLYKGFTQRRSVLVIHRDLTLVVDDVRGDRDADIAQNWHLFPGASFKRDGNDVRAAADGRPQLVLWETSDTPTNLDDVFGQTTPVIQGWESELYGQKQPNHALAYHAQSTAARFATLIGSGPLAGAQGSVSFVAADRDQLTLLACAGREAWEVAVAQQARSGERVQVRRLRRCVA
jgi:peptidoglycan/xylan/chitin deacetylase (PgdA/CDA1 family)